MSPTTRRSFLKSAAGPLLAAAGVAPAAALPTSAEDSRRCPPAPASPVQVTNRGDLFAIFGDSTAHGMRGSGFCGIWSLGSAHEPHNAFVSSAAGFIFNSHRGRQV